MKFFMKGDILLFVDYCLFFKLFIYRYDYSLKTIPCLYVGKNVFMRYLSCFEIIFAWSFYLKNSSAIISAITN